MPCWTVQTSEVNIANADETLLRAALEKMGFENVQTGVAATRYGARLVADRFRDRASVKVLPDGRVQVTSASQRTDLNAVASEVSRGYSTEVVRSAAKRFGWTMTETGEGKFQVQRRGM